MPRRAEAFLKDIERSIQRIRNYTEGYGFERFEKDDKTVDAVTKNLANIGEAVKNLPEEVTENSDYDWSQIARFRDFITHQYFKADEEIIWDIIENELDLLEEQVNRNQS